MAMMPDSKPHLKKILLVDDEESVRAVVSDVLREAGYEVGTASDGFRGLEKFQEEHWDVVVTDSVMPGMSGEDMVIAIRAISPGVPAILITGFPNTIKNGDRFEGVLSKPFKKRDILTIIASVLPGA